VGALIYGANGYTGELIARHAVACGLAPVLAGRDAARLAPLGAALGLEVRAFPLDDARALDAGLAGTQVVLHAAGPFARTSAPMVAACLRRGVHYLDITGEAAVFEAVAARGRDAERAGIMLLPGAGFDVVPSDCLAAHLKRRLPQATRLTLGFQALGRVSHGTATTMAENLHRGGCVRRGGRLVRVPGAWKTRTIDFGRGPVKAVTLPWGDVVTAWYSTAIPDIEVYMAAPFALRAGMRATRVLGPLLGSAPVQRLLKRRIDAAPAGPTAEQRARGASYLWGEVEDDAGQRRVARLRGPEGYTFTALTAVAIARAVLAGRFTAGFRTPSMAYGPDFVLGIEGVSREDADGGGAAR
jgi:short subunit dehydrogenase-like uncharacterized protein